MLIMKLHEIFIQINIQLISLGPEAHFVEFFPTHLNIHIIKLHHK